VRYGLRAPKLDCETCTEKKREQKNCHNRKKLIKTIVHKSEWLSWPESLKPYGGKWGDLKFYECPRSAITSKTWEILALVDETTEYNPSTKDTRTTSLPFEGAWLDQPEWYRQTFSIVKRERMLHQPEQKVTNGKR
jgi:hypothetical protein